MNINKNHITAASIIYLYAGVFCFILGWLSLPAAAVCSVLTIGVLILFGKSVSDKSENYYISKSTLVFIILFFLAACILCGHGTFIAQSGDWRKHNYILNDLVSRPWPVVYSANSENAMMSYYIGDYLPAALIAKPFGSFRAAEIMLLPWNAAGLFIAYINTAAALNVKTFKKHLFMLCSLALFSGMYLTIQFILDKLGITFFDSYRLVFPSNASQLRNAFIQMIPAWISVSLLLRDPKKIENYCVIGVPLIISSTIAFGGLVILMFVLAIADFDFKNISGSLKRIFSPQNILSAVGCAAVLIIYVFSNVIQEKPAEAGFSVMNLSSLTFWCCYIVFELTNVFYIFAPLYAVNKKAPKIVWASVITLMVIPFFYMGANNDWCMRACISPLFILMIYMTETVSGVFTDAGVLRRSKAIACAVCICILFGSTYTMGSLAVQVLKNGLTFDGSGRYGDISSLEDWCCRDGSVPIDKAYNYFIYDYEDSLFYKTVSKKVN